MKELIEAVTDRPSFPDASRDWQGPVQARIQRMATDEYSAQLAAYLKTGRKKTRFRWSPPAWLDAVVDALGRNDEEHAKSILLNPERYSDPA